jgi:metallo-beta-lactamase class B
VKAFFAASIGVALLSALALPNSASAQGSMAAAQAHIDKAKAAVYRPGFEFSQLYETVCRPAISEKGPAEELSLTVAEPLDVRRIPPRSDWYSEPAKVFDNLLWLGSYGNNRRVPEISGNSTWAVTTSDGIILIDTGMDFTVKPLIVDGLKKLGYDASQIKYIILSHAHNDRFYGARYLQDTYHPHVIMSEADWGILAENNDPAELKPVKDMIATDGMKLTLGDTTLTLYLTPGHTPGTISTIIPLKDGNEKHVCVVWGGINASWERYGVVYYHTFEDSLKAWSDSIARFQKIAAEAGADTYLTIHPHYDDALDKIHEVQYRTPGQPNAMVSKDALNRWFTVLKECTDAQLARLTATTGAGGQ